MPLDDIKDSKINNIATEEKQEENSDESLQEEQQQQSNEEEQKRQAEEQKQQEEQKRKAEEQKRQEEQKRKEEEQKALREQQKIDGENKFIEIKKAYDNNEISASNTYKGKTFVLYGKVVGIKESGLLNKLSNEIGITIEINKDGEWFYVFCSFPKTEREKLSKINTGDYILFNGTCYSWGNFSDCTIIE